jgi:hypothetical protein
MNDAARQERSRVLGAALPPDLDDDAARLHTLLEVAYLAAIADGELGDAEIHQLVGNLQAWLGEQLEPKFLVELFEHLADQVAAEGAGARLAAAAAKLDDAGRRIAYKLACVTTLCDQEVHDHELGFLGQVATAFGIPEAEAQATFDELDAAVTAVSAPS